MPTIRIDRSARVPMVGALGLAAAWVALVGPIIAAALPQTSRADDAKQSATITGTVVTTSGAPIAGVSVSVQPSKGDPQVVYSDAAGKFELTNIAPGTCWFSMWHRAYLIPNSPEFGPRPARGLTLAAGERLEMTVKLLEPARISGRAVDEDGDPVARAEVRLLRRIYSQGRRAVANISRSYSGDNGEFHFSSVQPGRYIVVVEKPLIETREPAYSGYFGSIPPSPAENRRAPIPAGKPGSKIYNPGTTYYGGSDIEAGAIPIDVTPGQDMGLGDIKMENRALVHVRGRVLGDAAALASARVVPLIETGSYRWDAGADIEKDGSFDLANVSPGAEVKIGVVARPQEFLSWARIAVGQDGADGVLLNASAFSISGTLSFEEGAPPQSAGARPIHVWVASNGWGAYMMSRSATLEHGGAFTVAGMTPGAYTAGVALPEGSYVKSMRLNGRDLSGGEFECRGGDPGLLELTASSKAATLDGALVDGDGQPAAGTVTLVPDSARGPRSAWYPAVTADAQGRFRFPTVPPGKYKLYGWQEIEDTAHWDPDFIRPFENLGQPLELQESGHATVTAKRIEATAMREALRKAGQL